MEMSLRSLFRKSIKWLWIIPLLAMIGLAAAHLYASSRARTVYSAEVSLICLNSSIWGNEINSDDVTNAKRLVSEFLGIANSQRVAVMVTRALEVQGISLNSLTVPGMITATSVSNNSIVTLKATSANRDLVIPLANAAGDSFALAIQDMFGVSYLTVLDPASLVRSASSINQNTYRVTGFAGGLLLGVALVYLLALFGKGIETVEDARHIGGVASLVLIPQHTLK